MARWIVRGCLSLVDVCCLLTMAFGEGASFLVGSFLLLVSTFVYVSMLEVLE